MSFSLTNRTRARTPALPYDTLTRAVLGSRYDLSIALVGDARTRALNSHYRGKDKPANVLAFPLEVRTGEIVLNLAAARREAPHFALSYRGMVTYLFIHGLLHLKGYAHGRRMDRLERELLAHYAPSSLPRHRH